MVSYENYGILEPFFEENRVQDILKIIYHDMFGRYRLVQHGGCQDWAFEVMIRKSVRKRLPSWRRREWDGGQLSRGEAEGISGEGKLEGWGQLRVFLQTYLWEVRCLRELSWLTLASALWQAWYRVNVQEIKVANTRTIFLLEWSDCKNKTFFLRSLQAME